jgi:hypothetical protein
VFKDCNVIFAQEYSSLNREGLLNQIARAKVAFLPYSHPNIGKEIYECLLLDTIPFVPDFEAFREIVPEPFRYPPEWTESIFNYSAHGFELTSKLKSILLDYDKHLDLLKTHCESLTEKFYHSEQIIKEILG